MSLQRTPLHTEPRAVEAVWKLQNLQNWSIENHSTRSKNALQVNCGPRFFPKVFSSEFSHSIYRSRVLKEHAKSDGKTENIHLIHLACSKGSQAGCWNKHDPRNRCLNSVLRVIRDRFTALLLLNIFQRVLDLDAKALRHSSHNPCAWFITTQTKPISSLLLFLLPHVIRIDRILVS